MSEFFQLVLFAGDLEKFGEKNLCSSLRLTLVCEKSHPESDVSSGEVDGDEVGVLASHGGVRPKPRSIEIMSSGFLWILSDLSFGFGSFVCFARAQASQERTSPKSVSLEMQLTSPLLTAFRMD